MDTPTPAGDPTAVAPDTLAVLRERRPPPWTLTDLGIPGPRPVYRVCARGRVLFDTSDRAAAELLIALVNGEPVPAGRLAELA